MHGSALLTPLFKLLLYVLAVIVSGALFSVPLFDASQWVYGRLSGSPLQQLGAVHWLMGHIERAEFARYVNRAVLVCAVVLVWPFARWMRIDRTLLPVWRPINTGVREGGVGFLMASGLTLLLGFALVRVGAYQPIQGVRWWSLSEPLLAAFGTSVVEEFVFRGLLFGLLLRTMPPLRAAVVATVVFTAVHLLRLPSGWPRMDDAIAWNSGFLVLRAMTAQIGAPVGEPIGALRSLVMELATLAGVGLVLMRVRIHTGTLWAGIGVHGGWVFGRRYVDALTDHYGGWMPWIGASLTEGLAPLLMVLCTGWALLHLLSPSPALFPLPSEGNAPIHGADPNLRAARTDRPPQTPA